jgi:hypothetical protein
MSGSADVRKGSIAPVSRPPPYVPLLGNLGHAATAKSDLRAGGDGASLLSPRSSDLPVGRFVDRGVESPLQKDFCFHAPQIKSRTLAIPPHKRGVS